MNLAIQSLSKPYCAIPINALYVAQDNIPCPATMKRTELVNHIKGSYLKKQYLEAFLVQSAYIEGLLKIVADFYYLQEVQEKLEGGNKIILELRQRIKRLTLNELVDFLFKCGLLDQLEKSSQQPSPEELQAQIAALLAQIQQLQSQLVNTDFKKII